MPTYVYETADDAEPVLRFEVRQSFGDKPLEVDSETGRPVRRVISGGYGPIVRGAFRGPSVGSVGSHSDG
jgi:predicted nucleic acid-binding Zn ribbon protein